MAVRNEFLSAKEKQVTSTLSLWNNFQNNGGVSP